MKEENKRFKITSMDEYLFNQGIHYEIYKKLGAHPVRIGDIEGVYFAVWAPNASNVCVVGDFNGWKKGRHVMHRLEQSGIYHLFVEGAKIGDVYKYAIESGTGMPLLKADPYGNQCQLRPYNGSVVADIDDFVWSDEIWQKNKSRIQAEDQPMAIYEVHIGSWKKDENGIDGQFLNYRQAAYQLADYVKYMGYTHVELMGIAEYPFDGSWGYQVSGYYAPTSRYGSAKDFMYMVDYLHNQGIGVILDWVPAHFAKDEHALGLFDGTHLYEHEDKARGEQPLWGTYVFDHGKPQVANFLYANALFWLEKFHVDGLRVDAVSSMLYQNFGREYDQCRPHTDGTDINDDSVEFFKYLNLIVHKRSPGSMIIAEESTAWPKVTGNVADEGLGFSYKWNMGWMNDFLTYMQIDPYFRKYDHNRLTFSFTYAYSENYILSLSHDEVVHLKKSMLSKMPGIGMAQFGNLRIAYGLMMAHPGKKLLFMGQDFAQLREWNENRSLDWELLEREAAHRQLNLYYKDLLKFYKSYSALYATDCDEAGFRWVYGDDRQHNMLTICRMNRHKKQCILFHFNFSPVVYRDFRIACLCPGRYIEVFNSDQVKYGGSGLLNQMPIDAEAIPWNWNEYSMKVNVPSYGMIAFAFDYQGSFQIVEK